jgi:hypothetical protein
MAYLKDEFRFKEGSTILVVKPKLVLEGEPVLFRTHNWFIKIALKEPFLPLL